MTCLSPCYVALLFVAWVRWFLLRHLWSALIEHIFFLGPVDCYSIYITVSFLYRRKKKNETMLSILVDYCSLGVLYFGQGYARYTSTSEKHFSSTTKSSWSLCGGPTLYESNFFNISNWDQNFYIEELKDRRKHICIVHTERGQKDYRIYFY